MVVKISLLFMIVVMVFSRLDNGPKHSYLHTMIVFVGFRQPPADEYSRLFKNFENRQNYITKQNEFD